MCPSLGLGTGGDRKDLATWALLADKTDWLLGEANMFPLHNSGDGVDTSPAFLGEWDIQKGSIEIIIAISHHCRMQVRSPCEDSEGL